MNHSQMLTTRRKKKKAAKDVTRVAKQAKKQGKQTAKAVDADATKRSPS